MARVRLWFGLVVLCALTAFVAAPSASAAPFSLTGPYGPEHFDSLATTGTANPATGLPVGWEFDEIGGGTRDDGNYAAGDGSSNTGDTYGYGTTAATDRALGQLRSGTLISTIGASFTNNTGSTIASLDVAYTGEQWRLGALTGVRPNGPDRMDFQYSLDATSLTTGTWLDVNALDFTSPVTGPTVGKLDGNLAANRTALSTTITGLSIANGSNFWIRFLDVNADDADDGLAIDDFSLTPHGPSATPALTINDVTQNEGNASTSTFTFTVSLDIAAGAGGVTFDIATADNTATDADNDYDQKSLIGETIPQGQSQHTFGVTVNGDATVEPNQTFFVNVTNVTGATVSDGQGLGTITNDDVTLTLIHDIQGATHISPMNGTSRSVRGVVTGTRTNGFYVEEEESDWDADDTTSEAIFVFTSSAPTNVVGDDVTVTGTVTEFRPGGSGSTNLTTTELGSPSVVTNATGTAVPGPTVIGSSGRVPPTMVIENDSGPDVETSNTFDPASDGIDFYESLEAMYVRVAGPVAVGPTNSFGEVPVLVEGGSAASVRTGRGGIVVRANDFNPERIIFDDEILVAQGSRCPR